MKKVINFLSYIWGKFKHNLGLKILSIFFAILLWNFVITGTNPGVTRTVEDLAVNFNGIAQLSDNNLALQDSISSYINTAKVTIEIKRNDLKAFDENDISVRLELSSITTPGEYDIPLYADANNGNILKITPESITVVVDEKYSMVIPVKSSMSGELTDNYYRGPLNITPNTIQVTGARSIVQKIEGAYIELDLTDMSESISITKQYIFVDSDGNEVDASPLSISTDSVLLEMDITPIKTLSLLPGLIGDDLIKDGYEIIKIEVQPETVDVTGLPEFLEGVVTISTDYIDLEGRFESISIFEIKIQVPEGLTLLGGIDTAAVLISIEEEMAEVDFEQVTVELRNIPNGLRSVDEEIKIDIRVRAPINTINDIAPSHIMLYVDLTGAQEGQTTLPILFETPEDYRVDNVILSQDNLTVTLN